MKGRWENGRLVVRFTLNFILHQLLLFLTVSLPAVFYIVVLNRPEQLLAVNLTIWIIVLAYLLYCLFYGYYVARPMADILAKIRQLSRGEYPPFGGRGGSFPFSSRLYREVYTDLESLSSTLRGNERKRQEFEQARQDWASGVTHDLKTPLTYISGYADMLLSDQHEWSPAEQKEFLRSIREKSAYMEELIHDLGIAFRMDRSADSEFASQAVELTECVRRTVAEAANLPLHKQNRFEISGGERPLYIKGDAGLLQRAVSNLLVNAIVHNPEGTSIFVSMESAENGSEVRLKIADNGTGMDGEKVARLFERYYRGTSTDTPMGGTGLGMAIVKQIVAAHQGSVSVESQVGSGTVITVALPVDRRSETERRSFPAHAD